MAPEEAKGSLSLPAGVRFADGADVPALTVSLVDAFREDPVHRWMFPSEVERRWGSARMFRVLLRQGLRRGVVLCPEDRSGASIWVPPTPPRERWRHLGAFYSQMALASAARPLRAARIGYLMERMHPRAPHWYLFVLGVRSGARGKGRSSALMDPVLRHCDATGSLAYLESSNERNLAVYGRRGFAVESEIPLSAKGPAVWPMFRTAKDPADGFG
jgi:GNAT superfamily N-acetyltransferase